MALLLVAALVTVPATHAENVLDTLRQGGNLHEEESRFLPGRYYFTKGNDYLRRGDADEAMRNWQVAAGWAMKDAQYNLGIAYFKGTGIAPDRPRGLAWLALAAERKDPQFTESLAAAWDQSSPAEHDQANALWRELRLRYADAVALPQAEQRFNTELAQLTGSHVGSPGHLRVWTSSGMLDVASYRKQLQDEADVSFGRLPRGRVDIGPLQSMDDEPPAPAREP